MVSCDGPIEWLCLVEGCYVELPKTASSTSQHMLPLVGLWDLERASQLTWAVVATSFHLHMSSPI